MSRFYIDWRNAMKLGVVFVVACVTSPALEHANAAPIVFDVLAIEPDVHPYDQRLRYEFSGTINGPAPAFDRDKLFIVSTTPNDADWVVSSGATAYVAPSFGANFVSDFGYSDNFTADYLQMDFISNLSVGDSVTTSGPYLSRFTFVTISTGNIDGGGLAVYWGRSSSTARRDSGTFLASDFNLTGPTSNVPEPTSLALLATGAFGFMGYSWRRKRKPLA